MDPANIDQNPMGRDVAGLKISLRVTAEEGSPNSFVQANRVGGSPEKPSGIFGESARWQIFEARAGLSQLIDTIHRTR